MKAITIVTDLASVVFMPFFLWFSLPPRALAIVDFFRKFIVQVGGLGVCLQLFRVCLPATRQRQGLSHFQSFIAACGLSPLCAREQFGAPTKESDARLISNDGKMEKSFNRSKRVTQGGFQQI